MERKPATPGGDIEQTFRLARIANSAREWRRIMAEDRATSADGSAGHQAQRHPRR